MQTADPFNYKSMLDATSKTAIEFARRHGHSYEAYVGIKRGPAPVHAAFNRMFLLRDLHESGFRGWVLYMDADAYVWDLDFDLKTYLSAHADRSAVMATIERQPIPWHINSGVLFFNMAHPDARRLIDIWLDRYLAIPDADLATITSVWDESNDQLWLCQSLERNPDIRDTVFFEEMIRINHKSGRFIRQFYGSWEADLARRTRFVALEVSHILGRSDCSVDDALTVETLVTEAYQRILRRPPDPVGLEFYSNILRDVGPCDGLLQVEGALLGSDEYRTITALAER